MASSGKAKGSEAEEEGEEEEKEKKEGSEAQKKKMVETEQRKHGKSVYFQEDRVCERKGKQKGSPTPQSETDPGEDWEVAPSPFAIVGAECVMCQRCSRRTAAKDGGDGEDAAGIPGKGGRWAEEIPQRWRRPKGEDSNLGTVVGEGNGAVASIPGNEGRLTQAEVNVRGGMRVFAGYFWHSEGWTPRNEALLEAVLKRARVTRHPWLVACDANLSPVDVEKKSLWFQRNRMLVVAPEKASTCRPEGVQREWIEKVYDYVVECNSLKGNVSQMEVVEDFESRPRKAVSFLVEKERRRQWNGASRRCRRCCLVKWRKVARKKHKRSR